MRILYPFTYLGTDIRVGSDSGAKLAGSHLSVTLHKVLHSLQPVLPGTICCTSLKVVRYLPPRYLK